MTHEIPTSAYDHLNAEASAQLSKSKQERITYIRSSRWIGYPKAKDIIGKMEDLLTYPPKHRMPCMLIVGDSNSGKTMIAERFINMHPAYEREDGEGIVIPALFIQSPPTPSESRLYSNILSKMFAPFRPSDSIDKKHHQVKTIMAACNVKMLIIDEIHSLLAGPLDKQRVFLSVIRNLSNELKIPIVGLGTKDALRAVKTDPQLDNRFKPSLLPRWEMDTDFRRLLASFERMLPLAEPSDLKSKAIAQKIHFMSEGLLGEVSDILTQAAIWAISHGAEHIDINVLDKIEYESLKERKKGQR
ncbi:TniB family NTP-binding protein [Pseudoalteromonas ruthenica]|uniref:TniB family NTP-binding protein n=1 Tax=Pseudoalteromonas ruthenica TaxID=151081 RepID=UPI001BB1504B|nr:TniB family NTP-binding protein [Pseudoalteromonas ruthenica]